MPTDGVDRVVDILARMGAVDGRRVRSVVRNGLVGLAAVHPFALLIEVDHGVRGLAERQHQTRAGTSSQSKFDWRILRSSIACGQMVQKTGWSSVNFGRLGPPKRRPSEPWTL